MGAKNLKGGSRGQIVALGRIVFWTVLASTPLGLWLFARRQWGGGFLFNLRRLALDYRWHLFLFAVIVVEKNWVDSLNDPIRGVFGHQTAIIHAIEGDFTYWVQKTFRADWLTNFLRIHYLWSYVFLNYFTVILFAYRGDRELTSLAALNYSLIYVLAIPFYIFFNVQITSDYIPGMDALLYHSGSSFFDFFVRVDPLDNAFPSLHIAIPFGLIMVMWWTMKRRGYTLKDWEHRWYLMFVIATTVTYAFSILYLGIHWVTDIPGGMLIGLMGAIIADEWKDDFFAACMGMERAFLATIRPVTKRLAPLVESLRDRVGR